MKKGVVILGGLLALAFCLPAVAQPSAKAVETIVIDNFDEQQDWSWGARASRFVAEGYPIVKTFEAMPNSLRAYHKEGDPEGLVLGTKIAFDRKGDNWFEVFPQDAEGNLHEIPFVGTTTTSLKFSSAMQTAAFMCLRQEASTSRDGGTSFLTFLHGSASTHISALAVET